MRFSVAFIMTVLFFASFCQANEAQYFQIGNKFERSFHRTAENIPLKLRKAAYSVAKFGRSTAFYVGKHNGKDVMVTTAHSALSKAIHHDKNLAYYKENTEELCKHYIGMEESPRRYFEFNLLDRVFDCKKLIAIFPELDLAFFELKPEKNFDLNPYGINFKSRRKFEKGTPLQFFSYSGFRNPGHLTFDLGFTYGDLCVPLINSNRVDFIESYDDLTNQPIKVPTIPIGCDASPGDSGAPLLNKNGELVGILWSVSNSDKPLVSNEDYLKKLISKNFAYTETERDFVWKNFNYASSLEKSLQHIKETTNSCQTLACKILKSLIE